MNVAAGLLEKGLPVPGPARLSDIDTLPLFRKREHLFNYSSFNRHGINSDCSWWLWVDTNRGETVLVDQTGPGCIDRIWCTIKEPITNHFLRIYLDDETDPNVDMTLKDFFSGTNAFLPFPLCAGKQQSSGGLVSYVPIPFERHCRISLKRSQSLGFFYNISGTAYNEADGLGTWSSNQNLQAVIDYWSSAGLGAETGRCEELWEGTCAVAPGQEKVIWSHEGCGVLRYMEYNPMPEETNISDNVYLKIYWDGQEAPSLDMPMGAFFGGVDGSCVWSGLLCGIRGDHTAYCSFPMPFWESALMVISNGSAESYSNDYIVGYTRDAYPYREAGYFSASCAHKIMTSDGRDFQILNTNGLGHVVGVTLDMIGASASRGYLEGDERVYIDGRLSPAIYGTGTEDFFNGGWYFERGPFTMPTHGNPYHNTLPTDRTFCYRFFIGDAVPFYESVAWSIEHGGTNQAEAEYRSVAYFYINRDVKGIGEGDFLDVGNPVSESNHQFNAEGVTGDWELSYAYPGTNDGVLITYDGHSITGWCSFVVSVPTNNMGVYLIRNMNRHVDAQRADVFINGVFTCIWYDADCWYYGNKRWHDSMVFIPPEVTAGHSNLTVWIEWNPTPRSMAWTAADYRVRPLMPLAADDIDHDGLPNSWELNYFQSVTNAAPYDHADGDALNNMEEYIAGTHPGDAASFLKITELIAPSQTASSIEWIGASGPVYTVQSAEPGAVATGFVWRTAASGPQSVGSNRVSCLLTTTNDKAWFRIKATRP